MKNSSKGTEQDSELVVSILTWLAAQPEILGRFIALSGVDIADLRRATTDSAVQLGILDFLMSHEPTLMDFATATETKPEHIQAAWARISGPGSAEFGW